MFRCSKETASSFGTLFHTCMVWSHLKANYWLIIIDPSVGPIGCPETSVTTNLRCVTSQKNEDLIYTARLKPEFRKIIGYILLVLLLLLLLLSSSSSSSLVGRDSSVGIVTCYGLDGPEIESRWRRDFSGRGAHPAFYTKGTGSFPGVKRPGLGFDHPPYIAPRSKKE